MDAGVEVVVDVDQPWRMVGQYARDYPCTLESLLYLLLPLLVRNLPARHSEPGSEGSWCGVAGAITIHCLVNTLVTLSGGLEISGIVPH